MLLKLMCMIYKSKYFENGAYTILFTDVRDQDHNNLNVKQH
jgi:hypothetical protein